MKEENPGYEELIQQVQQLKEELSRIKEQSQSSLESSQFDMDVLFQKAPMVMLILDRDRKICKLNQAAQAMSGRIERECIGMRGGEALRCFHSFDDPKGCGYSDVCESCVIRNTVLDTFKTGQDHQSVEASLFYTSQEGVVEVHVLVSTTLLNLAGKTRVLVCLSDITPIKQAEMALHESQEKYRSLVEMTSDWIWEVDQQGVFTYASPKIKTLLGYDPRELVGKTKPFDYMPIDEAQRVGRIFKKIASSRESFDGLENINLHRDGRRVVLETSGVPIFDRNGDLVGYRGIDRDITDRKEAEEKLQESEEKYRAMMSAMKDAAYICSSDYRIEYMNPRMISAVGHDAAGSFCYQSVYERKTPCPWCVFDKIKQGEQTDYELINPVNQRTYYITNSPIYYSGQSVSKLAIFRDVTEMKAMEADLWQKHKMESIGTLAGGIAHDFNNILYRILGNTELAMTDIEQWHPAHIKLENIKTAVLKAADIVKQILNYSRKSDRESRTVEAVTLVKSVITLLRATAPVTVNIRYHLPKRKIMLQAIPNDINQALINICTNSLQAMGSNGGELDIDVKTIRITDDTGMNLFGLASGGYLKLKISDTGPGINPEIIDRVFDPYFTTKEIGKGSGLGLAVADGIVKNHKGHIHVESEPGKGAEFTILLPLEKEKPVLKTGDDNNYKKASILIVDDEKYIIDIATQMLGPMGYQVKATTNPEEALQWYQSAPEAFDLVITDMTMPEMNGVELAGAIKKIKPEAPVILCTGFSEMIDKDKARMMGISAYVMKPILKDKIVRTIQYVLQTSNV